MSKREGDIQYDIITWLNAQDDCWAVNIIGGVGITPGTPDVLACIAGRFVAMELKKPKGYYGTTGTQKIALRRIQRAHGVGLKIESLEEVKILTKKLRSWWQRLITAGLTLFD